MKKLAALSAFVLVLSLNSCRSEPADEMFLEETEASGNVFLRNADSLQMTARDSTGTNPVTGLETEPPIPPRK